MRKELEGYASTHRAPLSEGGPLHLVISGLESMRRALWRWRIHSIAAGSPAWHRRQDRLARTSSVGRHLWNRNTFYMLTLPRCGSQLCVFPDVVMYYPANFTIGEDVFINRGSQLSAPAPVHIGSKVLIGPCVIINSGNHRYADPDAYIRDQGHELAPITIQDDVWLGAHVTVLPGVTVGRGAVVAAGAVVTRDVEPYTVVAGVPARAIKLRRDADEGC